MERQSRRKNNNSNN
jgi:hypothetical protein